MKFIFHIDINAFFANVEKIHNPDYANKPVAIGHKIVSSACYESRKFGIKSGMSLITAHKLCPHLITTFSDMGLYKKYSNKFFMVLKKHFLTPIEIVSIDECYADFSHRVSSISQALILAKEIQMKIYEEMNLTINIGISDNRFVAKMCSNLEKPLGIYASFGLKDFKNIFWNKPIEDFWGIGKIKIEILKKNKINTIGDFANFPKPEILKKIFINQYDSFMLNAHGQGNDYIEDGVIYPKHISSSKTFQIKNMDFNNIKDTLFFLCEKAYWKLNYFDLEVRSLVLSIKYEYDNIINYNIKISKALKTLDEIYLTCLRKVESVLAKATKPVYYLGINLKNLHKINYEKNLVISKIDNKDANENLSQIVLKVYKKTNHKLVIAKKIN